MSSSEELREAIKKAMIATAPMPGNHKHHAACIHNLPPEEQVTAQGRTVEWWLKWCGPLPRQITPSEWEVDVPDFVRESRRTFKGRDALKEDPQ